MGMPSPELVDLRLAKAFSAHDVEAAALVAGAGARAAKEVSHA